jgi:protein-S-isoprenylcysteine O-methyltransferase Ste14
MKDLHRKTFVGLLRVFAVMAALLFLPAWTVHYWQGWLFLSVYFAAISLIFLYLMKNDPKLLERRATRRLSDEKEKTQKVIQIVMLTTFVVAYVFPAFDHRFAWSKVPPYAVVAGDVLVVLGLLIVFIVFRENTYTSPVIELDAEQKVISTGPYALVRHPLYAGSLIGLFGMPLALGSWWGLFAFIPITLVLVWRLVAEEKFLVKNLPGYSDYRNKVKYRLLPFLW